MMNIGAFSVSLAVKDIARSAEFYRRLGFHDIGGDIKQRWLIVQNGNATIGLFEGMFEGNVLTFNPGWNAQAQELDTFTDIREIQKQLRAAGVTFATEADESTSGPASFSLLDPDGNAILFDQHR